MAVYHMIIRDDPTRETISTTVALSRLRAAEYFAKRKGLPLRKFLQIFKVLK